MDGTILDLMTDVGGNLYWRQRDNGISSGTDNTASTLYDTRPTSVRLSPQRVGTSVGRRWGWHLLPVERIITATHYISTNQLDLSRDNTIHSTLPPLLPILSISITTSGVTYITIPPSEGISPETIDPIPSQDEGHRMTTRPHSHPLERPIAPIHPVGYLNATPHIVQQRMRTSPFVYVIPPGAVLVLRTRERHIVAAYLAVEGEVVRLAVPTLIDASVSESNYSCNIDTIYRTEDAVRILVIPSLAHLGLGGSVDIPCYPDPWAMREAEALRMHLSTVCGTSYYGSVGVDITLRNGRWRGMAKL